MIKFYKFSNKDSKSKYPNKYYNIFCKKFSIYNISNKEFLRIGIALNLYMSDVNKSLLFYTYFIKSN